MQCELRTIVQTSLKVLKLLCKRPIAVRIVNDRQNPVDSATHSMQTNDHYEYSDRSLAHRATLSARAQHRTHIQSCTSMIDHTFRVIEHTRNRGSRDLLIGHFSFPPSLFPCPRRCPFHCTCIFTAPAHSSPTATHDHRRPPYTTISHYHSPLLHHIFSSLLHTITNPPSHSQPFTNFSTLCFLQL